MRESSGRPLYRPVMHCLVSQTFDFLRTMKAIVGPEPTDAILIAGLGWLTGARTTFPQPDETEDQAEQLLAIRRPEPVDSLAFHVGLPEAVAARRLSELEARGMVLRSGGGYLAAPALLRGPAMERIHREVFVEVAAFLEDLAALGVQLPMDHVAAHETRRRVVRLYMRHFLDSGIPEFLRRLGWEPRKAVIFVGVCDANYDALRASSDLTQALMLGSGVLPDDLRRPVSRTALARRLELPREATAKIVDELLAEGWLRVQGRGGLIAPADVLTGEQVGAIALRGWEATVAFVQALHQVGMPMPRSVRARRSSGV
uniref:hypothetical protein n=1 Tax=Phenylobacterium aquaticum TaxID=1763816 RepID=UPI0026EED2D7